MTSPRQHWSLIAVLEDKGETSGDSGGYSLAIGRWDGAVCLALRWNGSEKWGRTGNPQSRGLPTWFVIPSQFEEAILSDLGQRDPDKLKLAENFFPSLKARREVR